MNSSGVKLYLLKQSQSFASSRGHNRGIGDSNGQEQLDEPKRAAQGAQHTGAYDSRLMCDLETTGGRRIATHCNADGHVVTVTPGVNMSASTQSPGPGPLQDRPDAMHAGWHAAHTRSTKVRQGTDRYEPTGHLTAATAAAATANRGTHIDGGPTYDAYPLHTPSTHRPFCTHS